MGVVIRDILWAIWWVIIRAVPTIVWIWTLQHIRDDRFVVGFILSGVLYAFVMFLVLFFSNALPNLVFRYSARLDVRDVRVEGRDYHQIKVFGMWLFFTPLGESCLLTFTSGFSPIRHQHFTWSDDKICDFLNAHRKHDIESRNHVTFIRGEKAR